MSETENEEKPTPPVPPSDQFTIPSNRGHRTLEREAVDRCTCGGTLYDERHTTGRMVVHTWSPENWDSDEYRLEDEHPETERRVECDRCGAGYTY